MPKPPHSEWILEVLLVTLGAGGKYFFFTIWLLPDGHTDTFQGQSAWEWSWKKEGEQRNGKETNFHDVRDPWIKSHLLHLLDEPVHSIFCLNFNLFFCCLQPKELYQKNFNPLPSNPVLVTESLCPMLLPHVSGLITQWVSWFCCCQDRICSGQFYLIPTLEPGKFTSTCSRLNRKRLPFFLFLLYIYYIKTHIYNKTVI